AVLSAVLAGAFAPSGGVSLFVAFFVLAPMAQALFRAASIPRRLMPAAIALGTSTFTMTALPGKPAIQNAIPMPFFGTTPFAAPDLGVIAAAIMLTSGLWWLRRVETAARRANEGYGAEESGAYAAVAASEKLHEHIPTVREFDPAEIAHGGQGRDGPRPAVAVLPLFIVVAVNQLMSLVVLPRMDASFLAAHPFRPWQEFGRPSSHLQQRAPSSYFSTAANCPTFGSANASALPVLSIASLVGFGAVIAALPAFGAVRDWVLAIEADPWSRLLSQPMYLPHSLDPRPED